MDGTALWGGPFPNRIHPYRKLNEVKKTNIYEIPFYEIPFFPI